MKFVHQKPLQKKIVLFLLSFFVSKGPLFSWTFYALTSKLEESYAHQQSLMVAIVNPFTPWNCKALMVFRFVNHFVTDMIDCV